MSTARPKITETDNPDDALAELCEGFFADGDGLGEFETVQPEAMPESYRRLLVNGRVSFGHPVVRHTSVWLALRTASEMKEVLRGIRVSVRADEPMDWSNAIRRVRGTRSR